MYVASRIMAIGWSNILILYLLFISPLTAVSQSSPELVVSVDSVEAWPGEQDVVLTISLANYVDTVAGLELWLILNRPDICEFTAMFDTLYDSTFWRCLEWSGPDCLDSIDVTDSVLSDTGGNVEYDWIVIDTSIAWFAQFDTTGTLLSGWEWVKAKSIGDYGNNLFIDAIADLPGGGTTPGIEPQQGLTPLIKIYSDVFYIPDEWTDRTAEIMVQGVFYDPSGNTVPAGAIITDTIIDSSCFICDYWYDPDSTICLSYTMLPCDTEGVLFDSTWCCDTILQGHFDSTLMQIINGELSVRPHVCGDLNNDGEVNIFDVITLISFIYEGHQDEYVFPISYWDTNGDGFINIFDVVYLISFLYLSGPPPVCD